MLSIRNCHLKVAVSVTQKLSIFCFIQFTYYKKFIFFFFFYFFNSPNLPYFESYGTAIQYFFLYLVPFFLLMNRKQSFNRACQIKGASEVERCKERSHTLKSTLKVVTRSTAVDHTPQTPDTLCKLYQILTLCRWQTVVFPYFS